MFSPKLKRNTFHFYVLPLLKGDDPTVINNYRPISKLCVLAKIHESIVRDQQKEFFFKTVIAFYLFVKLDLEKDTVQ